MPLNQNNDEEGDDNDDGDDDHDDGDDRDDHYNNNKARESFQGLSQIATQWLSCQHQSSESIGWWTSPVQQITEDSQGVEYVSSRIFSDFPGGHIRHVPNWHWPTLRHVISLRQKQQVAAGSL